MKIQTIQQRLREAREKTGGRYVLYIEETGEQEVGILHWYRAHPWAFEDYRRVALGDVSDCVEKLERYAADFMSTVPVRSLQAAE